MKTYQFTAEPFSRVFLENKDKTIDERIALGMVEIAKYLPINFPENCMLPTVENIAENAAVGYTYGTGIYYYPWRYDMLIENYPENKDDILEIKELMEQYATTAIWERNCSADDLRLLKSHACWGGDWVGHANPDYDRLLHLGTNGIRKLIEDCRIKNPGKDYFYNACKLAMDSLDVLGDRICVEAKENAEKETDNKKRAEWNKISETFKKVPKEPAYDMYSAMMMFWMCFTVDGVDSPGRLDQFMIDYYRASSAEENDEMLDRFMEAMQNVRGWNLCISGSDEKWNDMTNELSYAILEKVTEKKYNTPNLTVRVHRNTPEKLWEMSAKCIGTGIGLPAIYNDEVVCPALEKIGIPSYDSHDYCMNGCNQIDIMGKSHMGLEDGEVNFGKVLEYTIHNGYDAKSGCKDLVTFRFGDPRECNTFEDFLNLYYKQLDHITDVAIRMANIGQEVYANFAPNPLRSCLIQGCLETGKDYKRGGPLYNHGQILAEGIADTADSLFAVKKLIFDEKKYAMDELISALEANYAGYDALRKDFTSCPKFGNDIPEVDELCAEIVNHFFLYLKTKKTYRGGIYTGGCSPFNRAADNGADVAALPNGKLCGDATYADSIAATPGQDKNGPTASIKSMLHYKQDEACSGFIAQMKFEKQLFNSEKGQEAFIALSKAYFANGGQQVSINVVDVQTLIAAQKEPEKYGNLVVRVGGYSDYFCNLSPELQQNIIDRTSFAV